VSERTGLVHAEAVWGTTVGLHLLADDPAVDLSAGRDAVVAWLHRVDEVLSTFRPESDLSRWRSGAAELEDCDPMVDEVLRLAHRARKATHGAFDPTWSGGPPDPTGLVKGWAADRARRILAALGIVDAQINAGGDVLAVGRNAAGQPWRIGIAHPLHPGQLVAVLEGEDVCVATSGPEHPGGRILRQGEPIADVACVSVCGHDLAGADAWSTALVAAGPRRQELADWLDGEGWPSLVVRPNGILQATRGWPGLSPSPPPSG
jgi:thiamine biosynthesis lipoprotein